MTEQTSYNEAFEELQQITAQIEEGRISIDELTAKVKRAALLIRICREKITSSEEEINKILTTIENDESQSSA
ncbi:MAG TPA: exodeoxyribonuclease VII small subunit [Bacteroidales bacterium]|nr:exodeoxyribonuclease VII small subunit [Bacteroidales bacterium]